MKVGRHKILLVLTDVAVLSGAYAFAYWLRLGTAGFGRHLGVFSETLPFVLLVSLFFHMRYGLFNAVLRYASIDTAVAVVKAVGLAVLTSSITMFLLFRLEGVPRSVFLIYAMAAVLGIGGSRLLIRLLRTGLRPTPKENACRVLLYGAGDAAEQVIRSLMAASHLDYDPVGILDSDVSLRGRAILGQKVYGDIGALREVAHATGANELWVCVQDMAGESLRELYRAASEARLRVKMLPKLERGFVESDLAAIRDVNIADLLRRPPRELDRERQRGWVQGRRILITGAGGSIGSELARQVWRLGPSHLALCDASESNLFEIDRELRNGSKSAALRPYLINVRDTEAVRWMVEETKPDIVFHAAAYKHVPMVEMHPCEGVLNNVLGLQNVALAAKEAGTGYFVFISTDKAVRPSSVMGATKRLGEILVQALSREGSTRYMAVRFGNVLGSSGSVVPIFQDQIRKGGPVTVTHPEMTRYFMLISEAVELVIQAGAMGKGGEVFILDMGKPVKILEMASDLIRLMGKEPERDVKIKITGVRPGEKIHEELLISPDASKTVHPDIWLDQVDPAFSWSRLVASLQQLQCAAVERSTAGTLGLLRDILPGFKPMRDATTLAVGTDNTGESEAVRAVSARSAAFEAE
ncbi:MAG: polysaccharide biosynthesis protein [Planctomycetes bacterium]|nr:polysaccharide biosynthesis protein [Planctomycetota bacterium]